MADTPSPPNPATGMFLKKTMLEYVSKKVTHRTPLNCRINSRVNGLFWRNNPI